MSVDLSALQEASDFISNRSDRPQYDLGPRPDLAVVVQAAVKELAMFRAPGTVCVRLDGLADKIAELLSHDVRRRGLDATADDCAYFAAGSVALLQSLAVQ